MNMNQIDLNLMKVFDAIMSEKNITKAAQKLSLSQPAISLALGRLRVLYNDPLFERSSQGMVPTHKANIMAKPVSQALEILKESLIKEAEFKPENCTRNFRVAMSDWLFLKLLPDFTSWLRKVAPGASLTVRSMLPKQMNQALLDGELDLAISGQANYGLNKYQQQLYREHYKTFVWSGHSAIKNKLSLKDFVRFPHVLFSPTGTGVAAVDKALQKKGLQRQIAIRVTYSLVIPFSLQHTDLIATAPAPLEKLARLLNVKVFDPPVLIPGHDIVQYWNKSSHTDPEHQWFRAAMVKFCKKK